MWRIVDGYLEPLLNVEGIVEPYCMPRQILPEVYWQNGYVDIIRPRIVLNIDVMCGHKIIPFVIHEPVLEIDYEDSIDRVENALSLIRQGKWGETERAGKRQPV